MVVMVCVVVLFIFFIWLKILNFLLGSNNCLHVAVFIYSVLWVFTKLKDIFHIKKLLKLLSLLV